MPSSKQVHAIASWFQGLKMTSFVKKQSYFEFTVTVDLTEDCSKGMKLLVSMA